jgi:hypothetical protein
MGWSADLPAAFGARTEPGSWQLASASGSCSRRGLPTASDLKAPGAASVDGPDRLPAGAAISNGSGSSSCTLRTGSTVADDLAVEGELVGVLGCRSMSRRKTSGRRRQPIEGAVTWQLPSVHGPEEPSHSRITAPGPTPSLRGQLSRATASVGASVEPHDLSPGQPVTASTSAGGCCTRPAGGPGKSFARRHRDIHRPASEGPLPGSRGVGHGDIERLGNDPPPGRTETWASRTRRGTS